MDVTIPDGEKLAHLVLLKTGAQVVKKALDSGEFKAEQEQALKQVIKMGLKLIAKLEEEEILIGNLSEEIVPIILYYS